MPTSADNLYLDSSALVKLVVDEAESQTLRGFLAGRAGRATSELARAEVVRAVRPHGEDAVRRARELLLELETLVPLDSKLLDDAADVEPGGLRTLDAIHLAAAATTLNGNGELITYDHRMQAAARALGFTVVAPGQR